MCGICGIYNYNKDFFISKQILHNMTQSISHRGPDDEGLFTNKFIGLGHRRLSVIDIKSGKQPMSNEDKTIWVTYNGEIYNHKTLKKHLVQKGHQFKTNCDTEVIVHAYEEYGEQCVLKFNGMFAFALWDKNNEKLFLARDRLGIKPLYYTVTGSSIIFASEIKAILLHPSVNTCVNINSIPEYLLCTTFLNSNTMFKNIHSLLPGHYITFKNKTNSITKYWDIKLKNSDEHNIKKCTNQISSFLDDSVKMRLMSDVPFGSLLSGGLDSSLISALATKYVKRLKTFAMEYSKNKKINLANSDTTYASLMADTFNTDHNEFIFSQDEYYNALEKVTWHVEKPVELTTPSLYLLHKNIKKHVTVVLSGEGADELFGGYFFFLNNAHAGRLTQFPWAPYLKEVSMLLNPDINKETNFRQNIKSSLDKYINRFDTDDFLNKVLYLFIKLYLLEMLERQDKTSMAWGVETRVPFLDHNIVEYVANIPSKYKIKKDIEKYILKESFKGILPDEIINRKKKPFPFPVDPKSLNQQKKLANAMVQSNSSKISNYFDKEKTKDFFNKKNMFSKIDHLAIFRTSHAMIALEVWHKAFNV